MIDWKAVAEACLRFKNGTPSSLSDVELCRAAERADYVRFNEVLSAALERQRAWATPGTSHGAR